MNFPMMKQDNSIKNFNFNQPPQQVNFNNNRVPPQQQHQQFFLPQMNFGPQSGRKESYDKS